MTKSVKSNNQVLENINVAPAPAPEKKSGNKRYNPSSVKTPEVESALKSTEGLSIRGVPLDDMKRTEILRYAAIMGYKGEKNPSKCFEFVSACVRNGEAERLLYVSKLRNTPARQSTMPDVTLIESGTKSDKSTLLSSKSTPLSRKTPSKSSSRSSRKRTVDAAVDSKPAVETRSGHKRSALPSSVSRSRSIKTSASPAVASDPLLRNGDAFVDNTDAASSGPPVYAGSADGEDDLISFNSLPEE